MIKGKEGMGMKYTFSHNYQNFIFLCCEKFNVRENYNLIFHIICKFKDRSIPNLINPPYDKNFYEFNTKH